MKKVAVVLLIVGLMLPMLAGPADAWRGGHGGFRHAGGHRGGWGRGGSFAGGLFVGLGVGALLTAPWWCCAAPAYAYPAYPAYPAYAPYPVYYPSYTPTYTAPEYTPVYSTPTYPTPQPVSPPPQGTPLPAPPGESQTPPAQPPQASAQNCQTVWVEGHYETRVMQNGQRYTSWIPAYTQQLCQ